MVRYLWLLCVFLVSCSSPSKKEKHNIAISIGFPQTELFEVTYNFSKPLRKWKFIRDRNAFRSKMWKVQSPGVTLYTNPQGVEFLISDSSVREIKLTAVPYKRNLNAEYEFTTHFSDGSLAIYPGHFAVVPFSGKEKRVTVGDHIPDPGVDYQLKVIGKTRALWGGKELKEGEVFTGKFSDHESGTYLYVGKLPMTELGSKVQALLDPALPLWTQKVIKQKYKKALSFLANRLGFFPEYQPFLMVNLDPQIEAYSPQFKKDEVHSGGGMLSMGKSRMIHQVLWGRKWNKPDSYAVSKFNHVLFHETIHFWPTIKKKDFKRYIWITEGGADSLAYRVALQVGAISRRQYVEAHNKALNECVRLYEKDDKLTQPPLGNKYKMGYYCGMLIGLVTERWIDSGDLFVFWKEFLERLKADDQTLSSHLYYATMAYQGASGEEIALLDEWIENRQKKLPQTTLGLLRAAGVEIAGKPGSYTIKL